MLWCIRANHEYVTIETDIKASCLPSCYSSAVLAIKYIPNTLKPISRFEQCMLLYQTMLLLVTASTQQCSRVWLLNC